MEEGRNLRDESDFLLFNTVVVLIRVARIGIATIAAVVAIAMFAIAVFTVSIAAIFAVTAIAIIVAILPLRHIYCVEYHADIGKLVFLGQ